MQGMNAAKLEKSSRLQAVLAFLRDRGERGATTAELQAATGSMAIHSDVAEVRANGVEVSCAYDGTSNGRRVYRYRLAAAGGR